jgi:hypothetical protein
MASVAAMIWWQRRQRKTRLPFGDDMKLLRSPGETQLKHTLKFDEDFAMWAMIAAGVPAFLFLVMISVLGKVPGVLQWGWLGLTLMVFVGSFIGAARWFAAKNRENSNRYLGYFGERIVAEHLEPLKLQGWRIFHDVPGISNGSSFNLDHIAVGPNGVFAIETKTRRNASCSDRFVRWIRGRGLKPGQLYGWPDHIVDWGGNACNSCKVREADDAHDSACD